MSFMRIGRTLLCALAWLLVSPGVDGQQPSLVEVEAPHVKGLRVVNDGFVVHAIFRNDTEKLCFVNKIELELPPQFVGGPREKSVLFKRGALSVEAHASQETEVEIRSVPFKASLSFLAFQSRQYSATIRFTERDLEGGTERQRTVDVLLDAQAPILSVIIGGLIGVPIVILFLRIYDKFQGRTGGKPFLISLLLGWLVVLIAVFLFRFTATEIPQSPIAIQIKDFYGGIVIGACFEPLARYFAKVG